MWGGTPGEMRGGVSKGGAGGVLGLRIDLGKWFSGPLCKSGGDGKWMVRGTSEGTAGVITSQCPR